MRTMNISKLDTKLGSVRNQGGEISTHGAMLSMLAEIASQTLQADSKECSFVTRYRPLTKKKKARKNIRLTVTQAQLLSANQLVRTFSLFEGNEMKRSFSYKCLILPDQCQVSFSSFGSEIKARNLIKDHLYQHLEEMNPDDIVKVAAHKENMKKVHSSHGKLVRKVKDEHIVSEYNSENKLNEYKFSVKRKENKYEVDIAKTDLINVTLSEECVDYFEDKPEKIMVHFDHDYSRIHKWEPVKNFQQKIGTFSSKEELKEQEFMPSINTHLLNIKTLGTAGEVINPAQCIVSDSCFEIMPDVGKVHAVKTETLPAGFQISSYKPRLNRTKTIKSGELPVLQDNRTQSDAASLDPEALRGYVYIERDEHRIHKKPKGKAKFIGQSAAEKEMAVHMIESMKLKGISEPLECQICVPPRVFTAPTTLISHYRSHAGIKPYECHICGSVFTRQHSLNYHLLIHSNKTRFTCDDCGRKFRHPSHFKEHQRRHTGEAPFECSDCMVRFKTRNTYKRHLKTRHGKVLTQSGGIIILSEEEFCRVRTSPRSLQSRVSTTTSSDKENSRRVRGKVANILRRGKQNKKTETNLLTDDKDDDYVPRINISKISNTVNFCTAEELIIPENHFLSDSSTTVVSHTQQALAVLGSIPTAVMLVPADSFTKCST